jgi:hypothetical protein
MKERVREILKTDFAKASGLDLNNLQKGTDEYRAVQDAVYLAGKRQSVFWSTLGSSYVDGDFGFRYNNYFLSQSEGIKPKLDKEKPEYKRCLDR